MTATVVTTSAAMPWLGSQRSMGSMLGALVYDSSIGGLMIRRGRASN